MLIELASLNNDIKRLLNKGYALRIDGAHLVVRDIPYLNAAGELQWGAIVAKLVFIDQRRVKQDNHQVYFAGSPPHGLNGHPIPNLGDSATNIMLIKSDVVVQRAFSNKPLGATGFPDFYEKIEHYVRVISGPAMERFGVSPLTFKVDADVIGNSVFKFHDTLTSRAEIGDLAAAFKQEVVALIGIGGTGSYLLDFLVKTPVSEIRGFDADEYYVHNAYRSPGKVDENELGKFKAEVHQSRYENFRKGLHLQRKFIDKTSIQDLDGVTFAFVCVDKGSARAEIFELLKNLGIPFIDVGIGINRKQGPLAGSIRTTYFAADTADKIIAKRLAPLTDDPDDDYRNNIQIAEINALNAALAIIKYKQLKGFYLDKNKAFHLVMVIEALKLFMNDDDE